MWAEMTPIYSEQKDNQDTEVVDSKLYFQKKWFFFLKLTGPNKDMFKSPAYTMLFMFKNQPYILF